MKIICRFLLVLSLMLGLNKVAIAECGCVQKDNQLTVTGQGKIKIVADIAAVRVAVELKDKDLAIVQNGLGKKSKDIIDALKKEKAMKVQTDAMLVYPNYDKDTQQLLLGYTGILPITFEAKTIDAGSLISLALKLGANKIEYVSIKPEDKIVAMATKDALALATKDALTKAEAILNTLSLIQKGVVQINAATRPYYPIGVLADTNFKSQMGGNLAPEITNKEQEVEVEITLIVSYG